MSGWYEPWFLLHLAPEPSMVDPKNKLCISRLSNEKKNV
jgi:hypothetical protein